MQHFSYDNATGRLSEVISLRALTCSQGPPHGVPTYLQHDTVLAAVKDGLEALIVWR
ncbi:MAG TPA: hypothetical protein VKT99_12655 [Xanthobacteraceae bacterium]|nr:hypothetical protein [Xanthobacteraceae bacterium]